MTERDAIVRDACDRSCAMRLLLDRRIHAQRLANRETWETVDMRQSGHRRFTWSVIRKANELLDAMGIPRNRLTGSVEVHALAAKPSDRTSYRRPPKGQARMTLPKDLYDSIVSHSHDERLPGWFQLACREVLGDCPRGTAALSASPTEPVPVSSHAGNGQLSREYCAAEYLTTPTQAAAYLETYLEDGTNGEISRACLVVIKALRGEC